MERLFLLDHSLKLKATYHPEDYVADLELTLVEGDPNDQTSKENSGA